MHPKQRTLLFIALAALIGGGLLMLGLTGIPRVVVGLLQGLVLPSYALGAAIFPNRQLGLLRGVFAVGMNIALMILGGFLLNTLPTGLDTNAWSVFSILITLTAIGLAYWHERRAFRPQAAQETPPLNVRNWLVVGATLLIVVAAFVLAQYGAEIQPRPGFTQLWLIPVADAGPGMMEVGIGNEEHTALTYRLDVYAGGQVVRTWDSIELQPGEKWEAEEDMTNYATGGSGIEALLYRLDEPEEVYRRVSWTFDTS